VVAELSANHQGSLERAGAIIDAAAAAGAHAVKLQTYTADTMTLDLDEGDFVITDPKSPWHGYSLYRLYEEAHTPWAWHEELFARCRERGLLCFSTPFDATAVDFLEGLDPPCYKIASFENTDVRLIQKVAATGKPVIMSTGMATIDELQLAVDSARGAGCEDLVLLACTSAYPADASEANLRTMVDLGERFDVHVGLSDHTPGIGCSIAAVALGACVIERHVTLARADGGVDASFSLEPAEVATLVRECARAFAALGEVRYGPTAGEEGSLQFRRSLYVCRDMKRGEALTDENMRAIRPGRGLPVRHHDALLGRRVRADVRRGTPLSWDLLEDVVQ
jgi:N-acetylneuraminate synthase